MSGGPRRLRDDERELWKGVTRSITPMRQVETDPETLGANPAVSKALSKARITTRTTTKTAATKTAIAPAAQKPKPSPLPALSPLSRRAKQRLARGTEEIDGRLDLHGRTQAEAHAALLSFLRSAQNRGAKNVLVITGKGARESNSARGVLKRQVPLWLKLPEFRSLVVGFEQAHVGHGGEGALYVRVRRA